MDASDDNHAQSKFQNTFRNSNISLHFEILLAYLLIVWTLRLSILNFFFEDYRYQKLKHFFNVIMIL